LAKTADGVARFGDSRLNVIGFGAYFGGFFGFGGNAARFSARSARHRRFVSNIRARFA
jgi:hypothetical protein